MSATHKAPEVRVEGVVEPKAPEVAFTIAFEEGGEERGSQSEISWNAARQYIHGMFGVRAGEKLVGVRVTKTGIQGRFRRE